MHLILPLSEDTYTKVETIEGQEVVVRVMDTADDDAEEENGENSSRDCDRYLRWADCVLLVFSVTSRKSFEALSAYVADFKRFQFNLPISQQVFLHKCVHCKNSLNY